EAWPTPCAMATAQKCLPFSAYRSSSVGGWDGIAPRTGPRRHLAFYHRSTNLPHSPTYRRAERAVLSASVKTRKRAKLIPRLALTGHRQGALAGTTAGRGHGFYDC